MRQIFRCVMAALSLSVFVGFVSCDKDDDKDKNQTENNGGANQNEGEKPNDSSNDNQGGNTDNGQGGGNESVNVTVSGSIAGYGYVDLGLSSGTLWATCNVGATSPEEYGNYYAWGETEIKEKFTSDNSKWQNVSYADLLSQGVIDKVNSDNENLFYGNLKAEYDAATANWGNNWRMPTIDEMRELYSLHNETGEFNGIKGRVFRGTNGNTLFLPFAGINFEELYGVGEEGYYWSATAFTYGGVKYACAADRLYVSLRGVLWGDVALDDGYSVRPVVKK